MFLRLSFPPFTGYCLTCSTTDRCGQVGQVLDEVVVLVENKINHLMLMHPLLPQRVFNLKFLSLVAPLMFFKYQFGFFPQNTWYYYIHRTYFMSILTVIACLFSKSY